jgi:glutamine synthetase
MSSSKAQDIAVANIFEIIKKQEIKFVDFRFSDYAGQWLHITHCADAISEEELTKGVAFDGSSVLAWKEINESDMILMPQLDSAFTDPFAVSPTLVLFCDVIEPTNSLGYDRDPRFIAKKAEAYLKESGIGEVAYFGPEPEFFVFDDVRFEANEYGSFYAIDSQEAPHNTSKIVDGGNLARRVQKKGAYFAPMPIDSGQDLRTASCTASTKSIGTYK